MEQENPMIRSIISSGKEPVYTYQKLINRQNYIALFKTISSTLIAILFFNTLFFGIMFEDTNTNLQMFALYMFIPNLFFGCSIWRVFKTQFNNAPILNHHDLWYADNMPKDNQKTLLAILAYICWKEGQNYISSISFVDLKDKKDKTNLAVRISFKTGKALYITEDCPIKHALLNILLDTVLCQKLVGSTIKIETRFETSSHIIIANIKEIGLKIDDLQFK